MTAGEETGVDEPRQPPVVPGVTRDISEPSGLPLRVTPAGRIEFGDGLPAVSPRVRTIDEVRAVLYNQTATGPDELYFMYRGVGWPEDVARFGRHSLRFDLTVLVAGLVGGEYVKTAGHYHPPLALGEEAEGNAAAFTYPELYQVVAGRAHYLLQKPASDGESGSLLDVVVVEAGPGDSLYVPPGYGHVAINPGPEPLVMVNVVDATFASLYGPYRERHGAAYYEIEEGGRAYWVVNDHYPDPPEPRLAGPTDLAEIGLVAGEPLYRQLARSPEAFTFLSRPRGDGPIP